MEQKSAGSSIITAVHLFLPHSSSRVVPQRDYKLQHMRLREEASLIGDMNLRWEMKRAVDKARETPELCQKAGVFFFLPQFKHRLQVEH